MSKNVCRIVLAVLIFLATVLVPLTAYLRKSTPVRYGEPELTLKPSIKATATPTPTPAPTQTPAPAPTVYELLKRTDKGTKPEQVLRLQQRLYELGFLAGEPDGYFGDDTFNAIVQFQHVNGLERDGIAGAETQKILFESDKVKDMTGNVYVKPPIGVTPPSAIEPTQTPEPIKLAMNDFTYGFMPNTRNYSESLYNDDTVSVSWEIMEADNSRLFISKIKISDAGQIRSALCGTVDKPATNTLQNLAGYYRAVAAVAGDDYAESGGIAVRQGINLSRGDFCENDLLIIDFKGDFHIYINAGAASGYESLKDDAYQAFSRGRALIINGIQQPNALSSIGEGFTVIGQISSLEYIAASASDSNAVEALLNRLSEIGVEHAYILNQGGASGVFVAGETYAKNPSGSKFIYDILYFASTDAEHGGVE